VELFDEVLNFIEKPRPERFDDLALRVFAHQFEHLAAYRDFCVHRGVTPTSVRGVNEVPAVSTAAFKYLVLGDAHAQRVFMTSGTTRGKDTRGRHFVPRLELYRASALTHLRSMLFADGRRLAMLSLHPSAARLPHSSLAQMIDWLIAEFGSGPGTYCADERAVDLDAAIRFLRGHQAGQAVCLLGTTAAFAALFRLLASQGEPIKLAAGSRLMDTGGAKGQLVALSTAEVVAMAQTYLGIAPQMVINEYGMTELCSQLYDATAFNSPRAPTAGVRGKLAPAWMRVVARDPRTLAALPAGQSGLLSFFDLANLGSVSALLTEDLGTVREDGSVLVHGRAYAAQPRGCALSIEEFGLLGPSDRAPVSAPASPRLSPAASAEEIITTARRMKEQPPVEPLLLARVLADLFAKWRQPDYPLRRRALDATCTLNGVNRELLDTSLDALLRNFTSDQLLSLARRCPPTQAVVGFIMPGNVTGAGLHEVVQSLLAGACPLIKPARADPYFFPALAASLRTLDLHLGARMAVLNWSRAEQEATQALSRACDLVVAFGDDSTMAQLAALMGDKLIDFGARMSIALIAREAILDDTLAQALARDATLFEQRGCLSLHQVFVEGANWQARELAQKIAHALGQMAQRWPPGQSDLGDQASARVVSEEAYWRMAGGQDLQVWGGPTGLEWRVIYDCEAELSASPLQRTLRITAAPDLDQLRRRLRPGELRVEGVALADPARRLVALEPRLRQLGASYFCSPGQLQSPPPAWPHGGGRLLRRLLQS